MLATKFKPAVPPESASVQVTPLAEPMVADKLWVVALEPATTNTPVWAVFKRKVKLLDEPAVKL